MFDLSTITHVQLTPVEPTGALRAFFAITLEDNFVIKDWRLLEPQSGTFMIAAPSRPRRVRCINCATRNSWGSKFCEKCGMSLGTYTLPPGAEAFVPIVKVTDTATYWKIRDLVLAEYRRLREASQATA